MTNTKWHYYHVTTICQVPGDDEQSTVIAITSNDERTFMRTGGDPGDIIAYVPCYEGQEERARLIATAPDMLAALKAMIALFENNDAVAYNANATRAIDAADRAIAKTQGE